MLCLCQNVYSYDQSAICIGLMRAAALFTNPHKFTWGSIVLINPYDLTHSGCAWVSPSWRCYHARYRPRPYDRYPLQACWPQAWLPQLACSFQTRREDCEDGKGSVAFVAQQCSEVGNLPSQEAYTNSTRASQGDGGVLEEDHATESEGKLVQSTDHAVRGA